MNEGEQGGRGPEGGPPSVLRHSLSPLPPQPPPPAAAAAAAKPSRSHCTKAERSECRLALATPGAAAAGEPRAQCRSNLPRRPGRPRSALPPRPADPFKPPGLAAAAPGENAGRGWGRSGAAVSGAAAGRPVRRAQQRGAGGRAETPGPRGARPGRSDGGGSESPGTAPSLAAMEPQHFPPSGQAPRLGTRPRGGRGRRPSLPGGRRDVRGSGRCEPLSSSSPRPARHPAAPAAEREGAAGGGGGGGSFFLGGVGGQTGWCSDCSRRRSKEREPLAASGEEGPAPERRRRRGDRRRRGGGGGSGGGEGGRGQAEETKGRWRLRMRSGAADIKPGPAGKEVAGLRTLPSAGSFHGNCRRLAEAPAPGAVGEGNFTEGADPGRTL
ncbi:uncharacterized protein ACOB7L_025888 [Callospermophilus lateralis]